VHVVFALRPKPGYIGTDFIEPNAGGGRNDPLSPAWFNVLVPLHSADRLSSLWPDAPTSPGRLPSRVRVIGLFEVAKQQIYWALDDLGLTLPAWPQASHDYPENQNLPAGDPNKLDLPPWRELRFVPFDESKHGGLGEKRAPATQKSEP
jgi:hypothetical protein